MPLDINSFGIGGEGLSGLFMGQQMAQQQFNDEAAREKLAADIANTQEITRQRALQNQATEALQPDAIASQRLKYQTEADDAKVAKYTKGAAAMSKMGAMLGSMPAAARPAALKQMADAYGVGEDDPMLGHLMSMDPNELPGMLDTYSKHLYDQSDTARAAANKSKEAFDLAKMQRESAEKIAAGNNATSLQVANLHEAGADRRSAATIGAKADANGKPLKESTDQAIARMIREKVASGEWTAQEGMEAAVRYKLALPNAGKPDTVGEMGMAPKAEQRIEDSIRGITGGSTKQAPAKGTPQISSKAEYDQLPSGAKYLDPQGNIRTKR